MTAEKKRIQEEFAALRKEVGMNMPTPEQRERLVELKRASDRAVEDSDYTHPDLAKCCCRDCTWRAKDRGNICGATLGTCTVFGWKKPTEYVWGERTDCPYHLKGDPE